MINLDDLTIGQARQLATQFGSVPPAVPQSGRVDHGWNIVVLDRGFVYVGLVSIDDRWVYIEHAANIRRWGTTRGLGELTSGPTSSTELDRVGSVRAPFHALQHMIAVEVGPWTSKLG